jgi:hypothetical protein
MQEHLICPRTVSILTNHFAAQDGIKKQAKIWLEPSGSDKSLSLQYHVLGNLKRCGPRESPNIKLFNRGFSQFITLFSLPRMVLENNQK